MLATALGESGPNVDPETDPPSPDNDDDPLYTPLPTGPDERVAMFIRRRP